MTSYPNEILQEHYACIKEDLVRRKRRREELGKEFVKLQNETSENEGKIKELVGQQQAYEQIFRILQENARYMR